MRTKWCTGQSAPTVAHSSTVTCPPNVAAFARITSSPITQSCATWTYAMIKVRFPTRVSTPALNRPAINSHKLAHYIVVANFQPRRFARIGNILRSQSDRRKRKERIIAADFRRPLHGNVRMQYTAFANFHVRTNHAIRANVRGRMDFCCGVNDRRGMDVHQDRVGTAVPGCPWAAGPCAGTAKNLSSFARPDSRERLPIRILMRASGSADFSFGLSPPDGN